MSRIVIVILIVTILEVLALIIIEILRESSLVWVLEIFCPGFPYKLQRNNEVSAGRELIPQILNKSLLNDYSCEYRRLTFFVYL
jgi:hypothetical protein